MELVPFLELEMVMLPKRIDSLPNELLRIVLGMVNSVEPMQVSIVNRVVSKRWKALIEDIFRSKQSLVIRRSRDWYPISTFSPIFNGLAHFNQQNSAVLLVSPKLSQGFLALVVRLFPQVENLVMTTRYITADTVMGSGPSDLMVQLCERVDLHEPFNRWASIKRVHLEGFKHLLPETIAQLEHCYLDSKDFAAISPQLSPKCISLSLFCVTLDEITQLTNACHIVNGITRLSFRVERDGAQVLSIVCDNFALLQMLEIFFWRAFHFNSDTVAQLAKLGHLSSLSLYFAHFDLANLVRSSRSLPTLNSVRILSLTFAGSVGLLADPADQFEGGQLCRVLASIFTGLRQLTIKHSNAQVRNAIGEHLVRFVHLVKHEIADIDD